ncbi:hypothetical protein [Pseudoalteromonas sp. GABNS16H]|uniref:hypothetical protein n=1 Tax=Pseudoalteromonas sp. GABNS16H TaxID=3025325 RepID=UPI00236255E0|nr:hypothetical protein [Pseudoalteromonas sp. GABNS16H]MDC9611876.1 hypothetical protein [Pseudoalteromonas sp. GABNS16H]
MTQAKLLDYLGLSWKRAARFVLPALHFGVDLTALSIDREGRCFKAIDAADSEEFDCIEPGDF